MRTLVVAALIALCACAQQAVKPADVLDEERFTAALMDATLLEARLNRELVHENRASIPLEEHWKQLYADNSTSADEFKRSFDWYAAHPDRMAAIYEEVLARLSQRKDEALQRPVVPLTKADALDTISSSGRNR